MATAGARMKLYDVVRVTVLSRRIDRDGWRINVRDPQVGDTGTVVDIAKVAGHPPLFVVESVAPDGNTIWLADFTPEELVIVQAAAT